MEKKLNLFRFTLVHRFSLEELGEVFTFGFTPNDAERHLRDLFPSALFDVKECFCINRPKNVVIFGTSNVNKLL